MVKARVTCGVVALAAAATLVPGTLSCRKDPTEIVFVVTTDLDCSKIVDTLVAVGPAADLESRPPATTSMTCIAGRLGALVVVPSGGDADEIAVRVISGVAKHAEQCQADGLRGGCIVARRALRFLPESSLRVPITMRASCIDVPCTGAGELQTCVRGACVAATLPDPSACKNDGCDESALGGVADSGASNDAVADATDARDAADGSVSTGDGTWIPMHPPMVGFAARASMVGVWTGKTMIVWGGELATSFTNDGAVYDPATDAWSPLLSAGLEARTGMVGLFAAEFGVAGGLIIWGGGNGNGVQPDGAVYDIDARSWARMDALPTGFVARGSTSAVWTGTEMIVWGGTNAGTDFADGAAYDPKKPPGAQWRTIAPSPLEARHGASAIWDGKKMHVYGGRNNDTVYGNAASYDPAVDRAASGAAWAKLPTPVNQGRPSAATALAPRASGSPLCIFLGGGDRNLSLAPGDGAVLDPDALDLTKWTSIGLPPLTDAPRLGAQVWYGAGRLWTWGGVATPMPIGAAARGDGASYDLGAKRWQTMPSGGPSARAYGVAVWTGTRAILWGGRTATTNDAGAVSGTIVGDGMMFVPQ